MSRRRWLAGLGTVLLLAGTMGCKVTDFSLLALFQPALGPEDHVVAGSLETVATSVKDKLERLGIHAQLMPEGQVIRIVATTPPAPTSQTFYVILSRRHTDQGEATHVHFEWQGMTNSGLKGQIKADVGGQTAAAPKTSPAGMTAAGP
jgi:hypothetical protein